MRSVSKIVLFMAVLALALSVSYGCKKESPVGTSSTAVESKQQAANQAGGGDVEQKICPVLNNPIDKKVYTVYKGKKVYFCCSMCIPEFEKNPEKYISKLPQFAK